jgi:hypothetical protein
MKAKGNEQSIVNGARQKQSDPAGYRTRVAGVGRINHYTTNTSWKKRVMRYMLCRSDTCSSIKIHKVAVSQMIYDWEWRYLNFAKCVLNYDRGRMDKGWVFVTYMAILFHLGRDNNARIRSLRIDKFAKKLYKNTSPMKSKYFLH